MNGLLTLLVWSAMVAESNPVTSAWSFLGESERNEMGYAIGSVLAVFVALFARWGKFDRDRAFYPTVLIVVASYYVLFAVMGGSVRALVIECGAMMVFIAAAVFGFKFNLWVVAAALVGHGIFDVFHAGVVTDPGVPVWWPPFCMAYDVCAGILLGLFLWNRAYPISPRSV
jgi:hypothetical protein